MAISDKKYKVCRDCGESFPCSYKLNGVQYQNYKRQRCEKCNPKLSNAQKLQKRVDKEPRTCTECKELKPYDSFYQRKTGSPYSVCKECNNIMCKPITREKHRSVKQMAVDLGGGKCQKCGYLKCTAALEFHHLDPTKKDFAISRIKSHSRLLKIQDELSKCILLCSNCHREEHNKGRIVLKTTSYVNDEFIREIW